MIGRLSQTTRHTNPDGTAYTEAEVEIVARDQAGRIEPTGEIRPFLVHAVAIPAMLRRSLVSIRPIEGGYAILEPYHGDE